MDGAVIEERLGLWNSRLKHEPDETIFIELAELDSRLIGFVCAIKDADQRWGALIDNLHVAPAHQSKGLGRRLMKDAAQWLNEQNEHQMYLWVYLENTSARAFYDRLGGEVVEQKSEIQPDGEMAEIIRYAWRSPFSL